MSADVTVLRQARRLRWLAIAGMLVVVLAYLFFVLTVWGQQLGDAAYQGRLAESRSLRVLDKDVLGSIGLPAFAAGAVVLLAVGAARRQWFAGVVVAAAFLVSIVSAEILKIALPRPVLAMEAEALMGSKAGLNTLPSGHTTYAMALVLGLVLLASPRFRPVVAMVGMIAVLTVAGGVVTAGWHRPSDVIAGIGLAAFWLSLTGSWLLRSRGVTIARQHGRTIVPLVGAVLAVLAGLTLMLLLSHPHATGAIAHLLANGIIFACVVVVVAVFTETLAHVDLGHAQSRSTSALRGTDLDPLQGKT